MSGHPPCCCNWVKRNARSTCTGTATAALSDAYLNWLWQPEPWSRKARQDAAFQGFAKRLGMVDYWKRYGWPDLCEPALSAGENAFTCQ